MTDEQRPDDTMTDPGAATASQQAEGETHEHEGHDHDHDHEEAHKLNQTVDIRDVGPCKKHIKVTVERSEIDNRINEKIKEMIKDQKSALRGFRPGKAPRSLIERRYGTELADQVKTEILMASLEQLAEEHELAVLAPPDLDPLKIALPKEGPFVYEFEVEVRPEFELPSYKGLKLKRPVKEFTEADVDREMRRLLAPHGQIVPKADGVAEAGDILIADVTVRDGDRVLNTINEYAVRVDSRLAFKDGVAEQFGEQVKGAKAGETREVDIALSANTAEPTLRGKKVKASFEVKDVKTLRLPELTHEFLHTFGVHSEDQFRELVRVLLQRRLEYQQRQAAREQVIQQLAVSTQWDLPNDLLIRQARRAMARRLMEMRSEGLSEEEIQGRLRVLEQDILTSTAIALKEHFVLQKIADQEKIDIDEEDIEDEIDRLAEMHDESPRRLRSRLEKDGQLEALAAEIVERKALDLILEHAEYEDIPLDQEAHAPVSTVEMQTVPGEMHDVTAEAPAPSEQQQESSSEPPSEQA